MSLSPDDPNPPPPPEISRLASDGIVSLVERGAHRASVLAGAPTESLRLTRPHEIFVLGLDDVRRGSGLEAARPAGWRYVVESEGTVAALADVLSDLDGIYRLAQVKYGREVGGTVAAFEVRGLHDRPVSVRVLLMPSIYFSSLWVIAQQGDGQFVPIQPVPPGFEAGRRYGEPEVLDLIRRRAADIDVIPPDSGLGD